ncbi:MAG: hypothetical protein IJ614_06100 [Prevotella sp.]|nr:hypothetical protein [Bacteroidaceae bacterium]MBR1505663.1 hypothetical protein [Prevotella sp.]
MKKQPFFLLVLGVLFLMGQSTYAKEINEKVTNVIWNLDFEQTEKSGDYYQYPTGWTIPNRGLSTALWPVNKDAYMSASVEGVVLKGWNAANHAMTKGNLLSRTLTDLPEGQYTITADVHTNLYQKLYLFAQGKTDGEQMVTSNSDWGVTEHVSVTVDVAQGRSLTFGLRLNESVTVNYDVDFYVDNFAVAFERTANLEQPVANWVNSSFETGTNTWTAVNNTTIPNGGGWRFYRSTGTTYNNVSLAPTAEAKNTNYSMLANVSAHHGSNVAIVGRRTYSTSATSATGAAVHTVGTIYQTLNSLPAGTYTATVWYRAVSTGATAPTTRIFARKTSVGSSNATYQLATPVTETNYERISRSSTISNSTITNVTFNKTWADVEWRPLSITFTINAATTVYVGVEYDVPATPQDANYYYPASGNNQKRYAIVAECMVDDVILTKQDAQPTAATYYLYNPLTDKFLSRGGDYGTLAKADDYGLPISVTLSDGAYRLQAQDGNDAARTDIYYGGGWWMWSDHWDGNEDNQAGYYAFRGAGSGNYQIQNLHWAGADNGTLYTTYVYNRADNARYGVAANGSEGDNVDDVQQTYWQLKTQAERDAIITARQNAQAAAVAAEVGLTATTPAELATAAEDGKFSTELTEPALSFVNNAGGWTWSGMPAAINSEWTPVGNPAYMDSGTEVFQGAGKFTKTVTGLEPGLYKVTLKGFHRDGTNAEMYAKEHTSGMTGITPSYLSANGRAVQLKTWASEATSTTEPNLPATAKTMFDAGSYKNEVFAMVGTDGKLTLEVVHPSNTTDSWLMLGDVTLTAYTGNKVKDGGVYYLYNPAYDKFLSKGFDWGTGAVIDDYGTPIQTNGADGATTYFKLHAVDIPDANLNYQGAWWTWSDNGTDDAEARWEFIPVDGGSYYLRNKHWSDNSGWWQYMYVFTNENEPNNMWRVAGNSNDQVGQTWFKDPDNIAWKLLTSQERNTLIAQRLERQNVATAAMAGVTVGSTAELESLLAGKMAMDVTPANISFKQSSNTVLAANWTIQGNRGQTSPEPATTSSDGTEVYETGVKFSKTITGLQEGLYKLTVQGFFREGYPDAVKTNHANGLEHMSTGYIRANGQHVQMMPWYDDATDLSTNNPNGIGDAGTAFNNGQYLNTLYTYVGSDGNLSLEIGNDNFWYGYWMFLGDVTLTQYIAGSEYYLRNKATGQYLGACADDYWGTNAMDDPVGLNLSISTSGTGVVIDTQVYGNTADAVNNAGDHYLYYNADRSKVHLDGTNTNTVWTMTRQSDGSYTFRNTGSVKNYLATSGKGNQLVLSTSGTANASKWELVSYAQRVQELRNMASGDAAVDASFLIKGGNFTRGDRRVLGNWNIVTDDTNYASGGGANTEFSTYFNNDNANRYEIGGSTQLRRGGLANNYVVEVWHHTFDISQTIVSGNPAIELPVGVYTLTAQCFDRQEGTGSQPSYLYITDNNTEKKAAFTAYNTSDNLGFGDGTIGSHFATDEANYRQSVVGKITGNNFTIGVKQGAKLTWSVFDNLRLTYRPFTASDVTEEKTDAESQIASLVNKGTAEFQINTSTEPHCQALATANSQTSAGSTVDDYCNALALILPANRDFAQAVENHDLLVNAPSETTYYNVKNISAGYDHRNKVLTFKSAAGADLTGNTTTMGWNETEGSLYPQTVTFQKVADVDQTSSVATDGWLTGTGAIAGGPVDINGQSMRELYSSSSAGTKLYQNVTGLPVGTYRAVLYATSHNARGEDGATLDGTDNTTAYVFATANGVTKKTFFTARGIQPGAVTGEPEEVTLENITVGTDGKLTLGLGLAKAGMTGWHTIQIKSLTKVSYNEYTMSYVRSDGTRVYVGTGTTTGLGNNHNQLRPTTDASKALAVKIDANTTADGTWWLRNPLSGDRRIGGNGAADAGFFTCDGDNGAYYDQSLSVAPTVAAANRVTLAVNSTYKFSTLMLPFEADCPAGVQACTVSDIDGSNIVLETTDKFKANVPYIVYAENGFDASDLAGYGAAFTDETITANHLTGTSLTDKTVYIPAGKYVLSHKKYTVAGGKEEDRVGFYRVTTDNTVKLPKNRAYFSIGSSAGVKEAYFFGAEDDETGLADLISGEKEVEGIYDVKGMRLPRMQKGVNVIRFTDGTTCKVTVK